MQTQLKEQAVRYFQNNIRYFETTHPKLFAKLVALENAIDQNHYTPKYEIILEEDDYFDVVDLQSGTKLYTQNSFDYAKQVAASVDFTRTANLYKTFHEYPLDLDDTQNISPLMHYIKKYNNEGKDLYQIHKFIFFGVGLGTHIRSVHEKIAAQNYLIIENDLELFRLSLFVTPYYLIALRSELSFAVFESKEEFESSAQKFLNHNFYYNHYIKYFEMLNFQGSQVRDFHLKVISQSQNIFFYGAILEQYLRPLNYIRDKYPFLNLLESYTDSPLSKHPVFLLAAGPSLAKNITLVQQNQHKTIIIAVSSTLQTLYKYNIKPDIVVHMDGFEPGVKHFTQLPSTDFLQESIFFLSARSPASLVSFLHGKSLFFYENGTFYKKSMGNLSAACVGSTTYLLSLALGVKEMYLLGLDLALDQKTGATHAHLHEFNNNLTLDATQHEDVMEFKTSQTEVEGNFSDTAITTIEYKLSIDSINASSISFKKEDQKVYNLSSGAKFANVIPLHPQDFTKKQFQPLDKADIASQLLELFQQSSSSELNNEELKLIWKKKQHLLHLLHTTKTYQNIHFQHSEAFLQLLIQIVEDFSQNQDEDFYDISLVLQEFFKYSYTYIFDFFNSKDLDTQHHIQSIQKHFFYALHQILMRYLDALEEI